MFPMRRSGQDRRATHSVKRLWHPLPFIAVTVLLLALGARFSSMTATAQDEFPSEGDRLFVDVDELNLRDGQGTGANVIEVLPAGTEVTFISLPANASDDGIDWYNVELDDGTTGWVAGEYLTPVGTSDSFTIGSTVEVATDEINLRAEPGLDAEILDVLPSATQAVIDSEPESLDGYTWYRINLDNGAEFGWVAGELLSFVSDPSAIAVGDLVMVITDELNIRSDAGLDADVLDTLTNGFTASVIDGPVDADGYTWYEIETDAITGWVAGAYLAVQ
jgi:uncharacterized protein YgiM (DUF1202 family)